MSFNLGSSVVNPLELLTKLDELRAGLESEQTQKILWAVEDEKEDKKEDRKNAASAKTKLAQQKKNQTDFFRNVKTFLDDVRKVLGQFADKNDKSENAEDTQKRAWLLSWVKGYNSQSYEDRWFAQVQKKFKSDWKEEAYGQMPNTFVKAYELGVENGIKQGKSERDNEWAAELRNADLLAKAAPASSAAASSPHVDNKYPAASASTSTTSATPQNPPLQPQDPAYAAIRIKQHVKEVLPTSENWTTERNALKPSFYKMLDAEAQTTNVLVNTDTKGERLYPNLYALSAANLEADAATGDVDATAYPKLHKRTVAHLLANPNELTLPKHKKIVDQAIQLAADATSEVSLLPLLQRIREAFTNDKNSELREGLKTAVGEVVRAAVSNVSNATEGTWARSVQGTIAQVANQTPQQWIDNKTEEKKAPWILVAVADLIKQKLTYRDTPPEPNTFLHAVEQTYVKLGVQAALRALGDEKQRIVERHVATANAEMKNIDALVDKWTFEQGEEKKSVRSFLATKIWQNMLSTLQLSYNVETPTKTPFERLQYSLQPLITEYKLHVPDTKIAYQEGNGLLVTPENTQELPLRDLVKAKKQEYWNQVKSGDDPDAKAVRDVIVKDAEQKLVDRVKTMLETGKTIDIAPITQPDWKWEAWNTQMVGKNASKLYKLFLGTIRRDVDAKDRDSSIKRLWNWYLDTYRSKLATFVHSANINQAIQIPNDRTTDIAYQEIAKFQQEGFKVFNEKKTEVLQRTGQATSVAQDQIQSAELAKQQAIAKQLLETAMRQSAEQDRDSCQMKLDACASRKEQAEKEVVDCQGQIRAIKQRFDQLFGSTNSASLQVAADAYEIRLHAEYLKLVTNYRPTTDAKEQNLRTFHAALVQLVNREKKALETATANFDIERKNILEEINSGYSIPTPASISDLKQALGAFKERLHRVYLAHINQYKEGAAGRSELEYNYVTALDAALKTLVEKTCADRVSNATRVSDAEKNAAIKSMQACEQDKLLKEQELKTCRADLDNEKKKAKTVPAPAPASLTACKNKLKTCRAEKEACLAIVEDRKTTVNSTGVPNAPTTSAPVTRPSPAPSTAVPTPAPVRPAVSSVAPLVSARSMDTRAGQSQRLPKRARAEQPVERDADATTLKLLLAKHADFAVLVWETLPASAQAQLHDLFLTTTPSDWTASEAKNVLVSVLAWDTILTDFQAHGKMPDVARPNMNTNPQYDRLRTHLANQWDGSMAAPPSELLPWQVQIGKVWKGRDGNQYELAEKVAEALLNDGKAFPGEGDWKITDRPTRYTTTNLLHVGMFLDHMTRTNDAAAQPGSVFAVIRDGVDRIWKTETKFVPKLTIHFLEQQRRIVECLRYIKNTFQSSDNAFDKAELKAFTEQVTQQTTVNKTNDEYFIAFAQYAIWHSWVSMLRGGNDALYNYARRTWEVPVDARYLNAFKRQSWLWKSWYDGVDRAHVSAKVDEKAGDAGATNLSRLLRGVMESQYVDIQRLNLLTDLQKRLLDLMIALLFATVPVYNDALSTSVKAFITKMQQVLPRTPSAPATLTFAPAFAPIGPSFSADQTKTASVGMEDDSLQALNPSFPSSSQSPGADSGPSESLFADSSASGQTWHGKDQKSASPSEVAPEPDAADAQVSRTDIAKDILRRMKANQPPASLLEMAGPIQTLLRKLYKGKRLGSNMDVIRQIRDAVSGERLQELLRDNWANVKDLAGSIAPRRGGGCTTAPPGTWPAAWFARLARFERATHRLAPQ
jgi:hypothetical protein